MKHVRFLSKTQKMFALRFITKSFTSLKTKQQFIIKVFFRGSLRIMTSQELK